MRFAPLAQSSKIAKVCFGAEPEALDLDHELPLSAESGHLREGYQTTVSVWNSSTRLTRRLLKPR
jgi:hypothetical protein